LECFCTKTPECSIFVCAWQDLSELASARTLETASTYAKNQPAPTYDPLLGIFDAPSSTTPVAATAALASLIEPASSRIGAKLMRRMGWRDGQGVGPRVTFAQRKKQAVELGLKMDANEGEEDGVGEAAKHYYAPLDRPLAQLEAVGVATDRGWGLGYRPGPSMARSMGPWRGDGVAATRVRDHDDIDDIYGDSTALPSFDDGEKRGTGIVDIGDEDDDYRMAGTGAQRRAKV
jgi:G patch domain-containing protein 1